MNKRSRDTAHLEMRSAVLDAAAAEVVARGWSGMRMQIVAERAGVSRQTRVVARYLASPTRS